MKGGALASPMWLTHEAPILWGEREKAIRYGSKGEAARAIAHLRLGAATIESFTGVAQH